METRWKAVRKRKEVSRNDAARSCYAPATMRTLQFARWATIVLIMLAAACQSGSEQAEPEAARPAPEKLNEKPSTMPGLNHGLLQSRSHILSCRAGGGPLEIALDYDRAGPKFLE